LSYSKIDAFKTCPLKFKFRYIYKIPSSENHAANFGTSIHNTLNQFYEHLKNGKAPSIDLLTDLYETNWIKYGYDSRAHENTRKKKGYEMLTKFYEKNAEEWVIPHYLERPFKIKVDNYCFTGRIDRIDKLKNGTYEIIDYKTGRLKKNKSLKSDLQLSIYALAGRDVYDLPVSKLSLYFIEDNEKVSTERSHEQLEKATDEIKSLACDINKSEFEANPGFSCKFCEYKRICNKSEI
jgi:DNA helicase-2/ATP-dependent DNA helicase PcrA